MGYLYRCMTCQYRSLWSFPPGFKRLSLPVVHKNMIPNFKVVGRSLESQWIKVSRTCLWRREQTWERENIYWCKLWTLILNGSPAETSFIGHGCPNMMSNGASCVFLLDKARILAKARRRAPGHGISALLCFLQLKGFRFILQEVIKRSCQNPKTWNPCSAIAYYAPKCLTFFLCPWNWQCQNSCDSFTFQISLSLWNCKSQSLDLPLCHLYFLFRHLITCFCQPIQERNGIL